MKIYEAVSRIQGLSYRASISLSEGRETRAEDHLRGIREVIEEYFNEPEEETIDLGTSSEGC